MHTKSRHFSDAIKVTNVLFVLGGAESLFVIGATAHPPLHGLSTAQPCLRDLIARSFCSMVHPGSFLHYGAPSTLLYIYYALKFNITLRNNI